jgi:hypothetical protein
MITQDDIEGMTPDDFAALATADEVVDRAKAGTAPFRRIRPDEELPLIRAYTVMRSLAGEMAVLLADLHKRQVDSMELHKDP